jgi:hypothetical protein
MLICAQKDDKASSVVRTNLDFLTTHPRRLCSSDVLARSTETHHLLLDSSAAPTDDIDLPT